MSDKPSESAILMNEIVLEMEDAIRKHGPFHSLHEAASVIREEFEEFWEIVRKKEENRSKDDIRNELIQLAAVAAKAALTFTSSLDASDLWEKYKREVIMIMKFAGWKSAAIESVDWMAWKEAHFYQGESPAEGFYEEMNP